MNRQEIITLCKQSIAFAKAGFEGISSGIWLGVAMVVFNTYADKFGIEPFINIHKWILVCSAISFIFYSIVNIKAVGVGK